MNLRKCLMSVVAIIATFSMISASADSSVVKDHEKAVAVKHNDDNNNNNNNGQWFREHSVQPGLLRHNPEEFSKDCAHDGNPSKQQQEWCAQQQNKFERQNRPNNWN